MGKPLFPEAMKIILFYYDTILREDRSVGKNLNNNTEIIHPTGLNFEPASKYGNYIFFCPSQRNMSNSVTLICMEALAR